MNWMDSIRTRKSVRTFESPLSLADREALQAYAETVDTLYGVPVRFVFLEAGNGLSSPVVRDRNRYHFYEKHTMGPVQGRWDVQKIDMGIALCHFRLVTSGTVLIRDPGLETPADTEYAASIEV